MNGSKWDQAFHHAVVYVRLNAMKIRMHDKVSFDSIILSVIIQELVECIVAIHCITIAVNPNPLVSVFFAAFPEIIPPHILCIGCVCTFAFLPKLFFADRFRKDLIILKFELKILKNVGRPSEFIERRPSLRI